MQDRSMPDTSGAVEIADRVWWVGQYLKDDPFQCHVYLIEHGDESVLIDPGSQLTFAHALEKIEDIVPFSSIRYFICHHQDPDITACLPTIDRMLERDDAVVVTDWRAAALLKHYALKNLRFWRVEEHGWQLELDGRRLEFVFTPYLHFPGAFCTFDWQTGTLFSSDLFGGFTEDWSLYAEDESYFESIRSFHEHYMPSREILAHGMQAIERFPIRQIAPQHGSIIPQHLVRFMINQLKSLECGIYLISKHDIDVQRLIKLNQFVRQMTETMLSYRDFRQLAEHFLQAAREVLPVVSLEFYVLEAGNRVTYLAEPNRYHGEPLDMTEHLVRLFDEQDPEARPCCRFSRGADGEPLLVLRLESYVPEILQTLAVFTLSETVTISSEFSDALAHLVTPLSVAVERELIYRRMEADRNAFFERSIRDPLAGLYNRYYMHDAAERLIGFHERNVQDDVALIMLDIDHFKQINDCHGHDVGDEVLRAVGQVIIEESRSVDVPVRFGGEEFALFMAGCALDAAIRRAEGIRERVGRLRFESEQGDFSVTISAGVAVHHPGETLEAFMRRADKALYRAKQDGRNRVASAEVVV